MGGMPKLMGAEVTGQDVLIAVGVESAAGALISTGVGATAGIGLIASSAGRCIAGSAVGYTVSGGVSNYFSSPTNTGLFSGLTTTQRVIPEKFINTGVGAFAGGAQSVAFSIINHEPIDPKQLSYDIFISGMLDFIADLPPFDIERKVLFKAFLRSSIINILANESSEQLYE